jgi:hypothetical protein
MPATKRRKITQLILDLLPGGSSIGLERAMKTWYQNLRNNGGFRLTETGYQALCMADVVSWSVDLDSRHLSQTMLLDLDSKLQWPYYLDRRGGKLVLFSTREAMMATLYGDVEQWLSNIQSPEKNHANQ